MNQSQQEGARIIVKDWLDVKSDESILIVTDDNHIAESQLIRKEAEKVGAFAAVMIMPIDSPQKGEFFDDLVGLMMKTDVIVGATTYSFITTNAVKTALAAGSRFLSLPLSTKDGRSMLEYDFMKMDTDIAIEKAQDITKAMEGAKEIHVTTKLGTDLTLNIEGRSTKYFTGVAKNKGDFASASFEIYVAPLEDKTNGKLVVDGAIGYVGKINHPFEVEFQNGEISYIQKNVNGKEFFDYLNSFDCDKMKVAAEFGIGLNQRANTDGNCYIEDESAYGTFHIGLGRNISFGGVNYAKGHFDIVVREPNIYVDGNLIMEKGRLTI